MQLIQYNNLVVWVQHQVVIESLFTVLARCAMTIGIAGIFMEVHQGPDNAPSDGPNMLKLEDLQDLLKQLYDIDESTKGGF